MKLSEEITEILANDLIINNFHLLDWIRRIEKLEAKVDANQLTRSTTDFDFNKPKDTSKAIRNHWVMEYAKEALNHRSIYDKADPEKCFNTAEEMVKEAEKRGLICYGYTKR